MRILSLGPIEGSRSLNLDGKDNKNLHKCSYIDDRQPRNEKGGERRRRRKKTEETRIVDKGRVKPKIRSSKRSYTPKRHLLYR